MAIYHEPDSDLYISQDQIDELVSAVIDSNYDVGSFAKRSSAYDILETLIRDCIAIGNGSEFFHDVIDYWVSGYDERAE